MQYKTVPAPMNLVIDKKGSMESAVKTYADLINKEAQGGWDLHSVSQMVVTQQPGCCSKTFCGKEAVSIQYNMIIFQKA